MSQEAIADGKCVVIGLQSTGEARTADVIAERGEELDEFVSGPKVSLQCPLFLPYMALVCCSCKPDSSWDHGYQHAVSPCKP